MERAINLANPEFEPTDEQLRQLSKVAFAGLQRANEQRLRQLRSTVLEARAEAFEAFRSRNPLD